MSKTLELTIDYDDGVDAFGTRVNSLVGHIMDLALPLDWVLGVACGMDYRAADIENRLMKTVRCIAKTAKYHASRGEAIDAEKLLHHVQAHMDPQQDVK